MAFSDTKTVAYLTNTSKTTAHIVARKHNASVAKDWECRSTTTYFEWKDFIHPDMKSECSGKRALKSDRGNPNCMEAAKYMETCFVFFFAIAMAIVGYYNVHCLEAVRIK